MNNFLSAYRAAKLIQRYNPKISFNNIYRSLLGAIENGSLESISIGNAKGILVSDLNAFAESQSWICGEVVIQ